VIGGTNLEKTTATIRFSICHRAGELHAFGRHAPISSSDDAHIASSSGQENTPASSSASSSRSLPLDQIKTDIRRNRLAQIVQTAQELNW